MAQPQVTLELIRTAQAATECEPAECDECTAKAIAAVFASVAANQPSVVTICGSTRFRAEMTAANRALTLAGYIVLAPGVFGHGGDEMTESQKVALDDLHLRKIDLADLVYVVNPGGYVGDSTRREIAYAHGRDKRVRYLVEVDQDELDFRPGGAR